MLTNMFLPAKFEKDVEKVLGLPGRLRRTICGTHNAAAFNHAEYPGLSSPLGSVSAREDEDIWLPKGLHIFGGNLRILLALRLLLVEMNDLKGLRYGAGA
jgi:hypothetical protein